MNTVVEISDPIEIELAERALALSKTRARWREIRDFYRPIINAFRALEITPTLSSDVDVSFSGDSHKLAAVVRILRTNGFTTTAGRPKAGDTMWYARYAHPECATNVWLYFTSNVCHRVKVGTKMVEQEIYETRCDGGDLTVAFPNAEHVNAIMVEGDASV